MDDVSATRISNWFHGYVDRFRSGGGLEPMQQLKLDHSLRVAEDAELVARRSGWPEAALRQARVTGLLHDVGRFSQFAEFGTFADRDSVDHARRGCEVLEAEAALADLDPSTVRAMTDAVRYHNRMGVPGDVAVASLPLVQLTRDADKLDIFRVVLEAITSGAVRRHPEILVGVNLDGPAGPTVLADIAAGRMASSRDVRTMADYLLLMAGWVYDINFAATMSEIGRRGILEGMADLLPDQPDVRSAMERVFAERDRRTV
ncbi:MAG: HD domain-containing protein [Planctomycetes bacterium]|nr:HD domain-containing protein [Planctomycetota bacterium]